METVTTSSPDCQLWISRGVLCTYGFQREEAILCFQKALTFDSDCAMAHYFIAYNNAADYNNPDGMDYCAGYQEAHKALEMSKQVTISDWEQALIEAQVHRFCWPVSSVPFTELHKNYANAMRSVYKRFGEDDSDIAAMFAESLMMLAPWILWTSPPDVKPAITETEELVAVLEKGLKKDPKHAGLCHFYIHTMELSHAPERALPAADVLRDCYPEQGHLVHMPGHIYMWVAMYKESIEVNKKAILADERYKSSTGRDNEVYKMYRMHNYHFTVWASMFDGQFATAMEYAEGAEKQLGVEAVTAVVGDLPLGVMYLETFGSLPWHVLVRFGKWEEIIARPLKSDEDMYTSTCATARYARGIAFAVLGRLGEADVERKKFYDLLHGKAILKRRLFSNVMHDPDKHSGILDVAECILNGEVEYHKKNYQDAFKYLRMAVERDANLIYDEPWGWMTPARHVLGALLLEHGDAESAEEVYREDLKQFKNNLWSLLGLYQALKSQGKTAELESVYTLYQKASARADVKIGASCLCATKMCQSS